MKIQIKRIKDYGEQRYIDDKSGKILCGGVVSQLFIDDKFKNIFVLERPRTYKGVANVRNDKTTAINESCCIPAGVYNCVLEWSERFKRDLFEIKGVQGRSETKFHSGNHILNSDGCPLVGKRLVNNVIDQKDKKLSYQVFISESKKAEEELKTLFPKGEFKIEFIDCYE